MPFLLCCRGNHIQEQKSNYYTRFILFYVILFLFHIFLTWCNYYYSFLLLSTNFPLLSVIVLPLPSIFLLILPSSLLAFTFLASIILFCQLFNGLFILSFFFVLPVNFFLGSTLLLLFYFSFFPFFPFSTIILFLRSFFYFFLSPPLFFWCRNTTLSRCKFYVLLYSFRDAWNFSLYFISLLSLIFFILDGQHVFITSAIWKIVVNLK